MVGMLMTKAIYYPKQNGCSSIKQKYKYLMIWLHIQRKWNQYFQEVLDAYVHWRITENIQDI
jgi:hypothetical protein